ncbi:tetratricopeptide repeat protein [Natronosporangium hydrolyticum]|uniref:Tetratricopeptide repeat protein n=1 Tax=Natronosporangium hydrolyticum TaxID=2811111 RepID=A0A895YGT4_9ACTN|nr:AfsR/SARP family transcriptional regulator [Natronosporangium hydrolyticum]QSB12898.1 tetratricopeptide repeat protein [Natronosporangium hydrolyticum]
MGPLEVRAAGELIAIRGHRRRVVLLLLLLEPGRVITGDRLVQAIWDDAPPKTAATQVQICVSQLRSLLATATGSELIRTHAAGYYLQVPDETVDMVRFRALVSRARALAQEGDQAVAASELRAALDLWRGEVGSGVDSRVVSAAAVRLAEERLTALHEWLDLEFALGRHHEHIGELRELVEAYPLRERLHAQLALALYRAGRQAEALSACRQARRVLATEHGIDPGAELRALERAILDNDPTLELPTNGSAAPVPRQLPAPPQDFGGRADEVSTLLAYLAPAVDPAGDHAATDQAMRLAFVSGAPGIGKSALAIQVAHQVQAAFPDGQLYAHLRGTDTMPVRPEQVLNQFLRALGAPPETLPTDLAELAAQYRTWLAGRRILILLDDATDEAQVRHLAPGDPGSALIVTSRHAMPRLGGARHIALGVLAPEAGRELLRQVIGAERAEQEPTATAELAELCDHLPLALQIAAAKLAVMPHWQVAQLVDRLHDERRRLDELTLDDVGVRPSLTISYQALPEAAARLLALLSALGATDFAGWVAAPLLDATVSDATEALDHLVAGRLVEVRGGAGYQARYRLHDLTRIFARERLADEVPAPERIEAQRRLLRCWLHLATAAHQREYGGDHTVLHSAVPHWPLPPKLVANLLVEPLHWFQTEYENLLAAVTIAAQLGCDDICWDLAVTSVTLFENRSYHDAWLQTHEVAMAAVQASGNRRGQAALWYSLGGMALAQLRLTDAQRDLTRALSWFAEVGDVHGRGLALRDLASVDRLQGRYQRARQRGNGALAYVRNAGDRVAEAHVLRGLAQIEMDQGRPTEAEATLREALAICSALTARRIETQVRYRLGQVLLIRKELVAAEGSFREVLAAAEESRDTVGRANALLGLGTVHLAAEEYDLAGTVLTEALRAARNGGSRLVEGQALLALAEAYLQRDDQVSAHQTLDRADAVFRGLGTPTWQQRSEQLRRHAAAVEVVTTPLRPR